MLVVLTNCSRRKRFEASPDLSVRALTKGSLDQVITEWVDRVGMATSVAEARNLYCGRAFVETSGAADIASAELMIVSAGHGVVRANRRLPSYDLTVSSSACSNVLGLVDEKATPADWWLTLTSLGGFVGIREALDLVDADLFLIALPSSYLSMVARDLSSLSATSKARLRIFTAPSFRFEDADLEQAKMPYDARLDGSDSPRPGTATDFAARALRDFVGEILPVIPAGNCEEHKAAVISRLSDWKTQVHSTRERRSDAELIEVIRRDWCIAGASASRMLRRIRDDLGLACEQGRLAALYRSVRDDLEQYP